MFPVNIIHDKAERLGLKYLVIGGHAVNAYATVRATVDVDLLVCLDDVEKWTELVIETRRRNFSTVLTSLRDRVAPGCDGREQQHLQ